MADTLIYVSQDGSRLVTKGDLTLYYFTPQRYNPTHGGPKDKVIPWMAEFPFYLKDWIEDWSPLVGKAIFKKQRGKQNNGIEKSDFAPIKRGGGPKKGKEQIMFRNWYLYTYKGDSANQVNGEVNGIWQKATPDLRDLRDYIDPKAPIEDQGIAGGP